MDSDEYVFVDAVEEPTSRPAVPTYPRPPGSTPAAAPTVAPAPTTAPAPQQQLPPGSSSSNNPADEARRKMQELDEESSKLRDLQQAQAQAHAQAQAPTADQSQGQQQDQAMTTGAEQRVFPTVQEKEEADARSVYVAGVHVTAGAEELQHHFEQCGNISRVTIIADKFTGQPKGFAYVEFADRESVQTALLLNNSSFHGKTITVTPKRTNVPGMGRGRGNPMASMMMNPMASMMMGMGGMGMGGRGRGRGRATMMSMMMPMMIPFPMPWGGGYGGRGRGRGRGAGGPGGPAPGTNPY